MKNHKSKIGSAGRQGDNIRSDCHVQIKIESKGGVKINLTSKVKSLYGKSILTQIKSLLQFYKIKNAEITINDRGALPFVINARCESAIKRANKSITEIYSSITKTYRSTNTKFRIRRSRLYVPGNEPHYFINAKLYKPDCIILDLEDSVAPSEKDSARILVRNALLNVDFGGSERMVRINQLPEGIKDLEQVAENVQTILLPKCESANQIKEVDNFLDQLNNKTKKKKDIFLIPIIESALGVVNAFEIASSSSRVCALAVGLEDYTADIGVERTKVGSESFFARCVVINAAKAAGVQALDSVFSDLSDEEGLKENSLEAKAIGFDGKGCIHPKQIKIINDAFNPSEKEIDYAQQVIAAYNNAIKNGSGVVTIGSKMIDAPVIKRAQKILMMAKNQK